MFRLRVWLIRKLMRGGDDNMVLVFATLIVFNSKTFSQVPDILKDAVRAELLVMGLDENGAPIVVA